MMADDERGRVRGEKLTNPMKFHRWPANLVCGPLLSTELCTGSVDNPELPPRPDGRV